MDPWKPPVPPHCYRCGKSNPIVMRDGDLFYWLCGDCLYREDHPEAPKPLQMPWARRPLKLQEEKLF